MEGVSSYPMRWRDTPTGYGWISIILHWLIVLAIIALLFIGDSIGEEGDYMLRLHTSIALTAYILIAIRIWWRLKQGHPGPLPGQQGWSFTLGKIVHYILIAASGVMLVSGPIMAWSGLLPIRFFGFFEVPNPIGHHLTLFDIALAAHIIGAVTLAAGTLLHIGGVLKHTIWNHDETLVKMLIPHKLAEGEPDLPPREAAKLKAKPAADAAPEAPSK